MRIGGVQKLSLIDYPGKVAIVIFTQGCNFRCPYCHNRELVLPQEYKDTIPEQEVLSLLKNRRRYFDAVVVTGGEPTEQKDLAGFLIRVKAMGYLIKLDTNGSRPEMLRGLMIRGLIDYIAMDIKSSPEKYAKAIGVNFPYEKIQQSIDLIKSSHLPHRFRTTVVEPMCGFSDVCRIAALLEDTPNYRLQAFRSSPKMVNPGVQNIAQIPKEEVEAWENSIPLQ